MKKLHLLHDEQGNPSSMRHLLFLVAMPMVVGMTVVEIHGHRLQPTVWTFWGTVSSMLITGCFGPRIAQYLGPQIGQAVSAIGQAKRDARLPSRLDDERGSDQ